MERTTGCAEVEGDCYTADGTTKFGADLKDRFLLAEGFTNFNYGSFGSVPRVVSDAQRSYSLQCEARPDKWFRQVLVVQVHPCECYPSPTLDTGDANMEQDLLTITFMLFA